MKVCPYVIFPGNCKDAIALYEKAFKVKIEVSRYGDAPAEDGYVCPDNIKDLVMHAQLNLGGETIMLCDNPPEFPFTIGENISIMVEFDDEESAGFAFDVLKEGGEVGMSLRETFWSKCFGSLCDKFDIGWNISAGSKVL